MSKEWFQDITYDGLALSVMFDEDGPCEIMAKSTGDNWTDHLQPHIKGLIFSAAKDEQRKLQAAEIVNFNYDRGQARYEEMREGASA